MQCTDTPVHLVKEIKKYLKVVLVNNSYQDIFLKKITGLGHLYYLSSVIPLKVEEVEVLLYKIPQKVAVFTNNVTSNLDLSKMF